MKTQYAISAKRCAYTLVEVSVAIAVLGLVTAASIQALLRTNYNAALSRLQTGASTVAQNRIDLILADGPFNPQKGKTPPVLQPGTSQIGSAASPSVPIYTDPATGEVSVLGWVESTVANTNTTYNGNPLNLYRATVTVSYNYRGKPYSVRMNTVRASDL